HSTLLTLDGQAESARCAGFLPSAAGCRRWHDRVQGLCRAQDEGGGKLSADRGGCPGNRETIFPNAKPLNSLRLPIRFRLSPEGTLAVKGRGSAIGSLRPAGRNDTLLVIPTPLLPTPGLAGEDLIDAANPERHVRPELPGHDPAQRPQGGLS